MQSANLDNYSIINDYTGVPVTKAAINSPDVNAVYAHLETLANLAAIVHGADTRAVLAMRVFTKSLTGGIRGFVGDSLNWNTIFGVHHARVVTNDSKYATMG